MNRPSRLIISLLLPAYCVSGADLREQAYQIRLQHLGPEHPNTIKSLQQLVDLYNTWDKPEKTEHWRVKLSQTEAEEQ